MVVLIYQDTYSHRNLKMRTFETQAAADAFLNYSGLCLPGELMEYILISGVGGIVNGTIDKTGDLE